MTPLAQRSPAPPAHLQPLLAVLLDPRRGVELDAPTWDRVIRMARAARLLGVLAARLEHATGLEALDEPVRRHLIAARIEADFRRQKTQYLLATITPYLGAAATPCILLKGAAYLAQGLTLAEGRLPADVDVMVPRGALDAIEQSLLGAGWQFEKNDPYDQHFYRAWSHELPPLRVSGQALELDLHHAILPPLGRLKPVTPALFASARRLPGSRFSVLDPADQVALAAAHLFHDSDCTDRLRDLVDIDAMLRAFPAADAQFWQRLVQQARLHQLGRPLWYAAWFARGWLATPITDVVLADIDQFRPPAFAAAMMQAMVTRTLPPLDPDLEAERATRWASRFLLARSTWLRYPPPLLAYHTLRKAMRALRRNPERLPDGAGG